MAAVETLERVLKLTLFVFAFLWILGLQAAWASPVPTVSKVTPSPAIYGNATLTITGANFDSTAQVQVNGVAFTTKFVSVKKLTAKGVLQSVVGDVAPLTVTTIGGGASQIYPLELGAVKNPKVSYKEAFRLLEQASWGPDPQSIADVEKMGVSAWIEDQMTQPVTQINSPPAGASVSYQMEQFLSGAMTAPDQLRERVSFALGEIFVVSSEKTVTTGMVAYFNQLQQDAFVNFRQLMGDVTLSPAMGNYLDMVNNARAMGGFAPNENYARELMQLFTIGTIALNSDATPRLDANGNTIPNYGESDIQHLTRAFTGWTYAPQTGSFFNAQNYSAPMIAYESYHDNGLKTFLGKTIPAGQTAEQDVNAALDIIFNHPNVGPFIALRLIQHLVTSNPSPAYVERIADVFENNGHHVRGDLAAVVKAILLDREARAGDTTKPAAATSGHLREPALYALAILRALGATVGPNNTLEYHLNQMGQLVFLPATVFNYYSPLYRINDGTIGAPEFQILSPSTAVLRANFVDAAVRNLLGADTNVDLTPFLALASNSDALIDAVSNTLFGGAMPATMRTTIATALSAEPNLTNRTCYALYLAATASLYQVEH